MELSTIDYIRDNLSQAELYGQLAEECTELAQAALKMQRLFMPINMPRMDPYDCREKLEEEIADVRLCLRVLRLSSHSTIENYKANRWASNIADQLRKEG